MAVFTTLFIASMALKGLGAILGEKAKDKQAKEDKKQANKAYSRDMRDIGLTAYTDRRQTARQYKDAAIASARSTSTTQSQAAVGNVGGNSVANIVQQFMSEGATNEMVIRENESVRKYQRDNDKYNANGARISRGGEYKYNFLSGLGNLLGTTAEIAGAYSQHSYQVTSARQKTITDYPSPTNQP
jgi:hypothetical protein